MGFSVEGTGVKTDRERLVYFEINDSSRMLSVNIDQEEWVSLLS